MNMGKTKEEALEFVGKDVPKGGIDDVGSNIIQQSDEFIKRNEAVQNYQDLEGRDPTEQELDAIVGMQGLTNQNNTTVPDAPTVDQNDAVQQFVQQQYADIFGRDADQAGFDYWTDQIKSGAISQDDVTKSFKLSPEAKMRGVYQAV